jgi:hypothetical protein
MMKKQMWAITLMCVLAVGLMLFARHSISVQADPFQVTMPPPATPIDNASKIISAYNKVYTGQIDDNGPTETWVFPVQGKDVVSLQVTRLSGTLVPQISIQDSAGKVISSANPDNTFAQSTIQGVQLPNPGTYNIVVSRLDASAGKTSGTYQVQVYLIGAGPDRIKLHDSEIKELGDGAGGNLVFEQWAEEFSLSCDYAYLRFTVLRTSDNLIPILTILDDQHKILAQSLPDNDSGTATLDVLMPKTFKPCFILISRKGNEKGSTYGRFHLKIDLLGAGLNGDPTDATSMIVRTFTVGQPQNIGIDNLSIQEKYLLRVDSTAPLTITVMRTDGTLVPAIKVFDMNRKELASADADATFATATIRFVPPMPGQYLITVFRRDGITGQTQGGGTLLVQPASH